MAAEIDAQEAMVRMERQEAESVLAELREMPPARRDLLVANSRRYQTLSLSQALVRESFRLRFEDRPRALALAEAACQVADQLDPERYGKGVVQDARAACWGQLGNARRFNSDLPGADKAFSIARQHLATGTGDLFEVARLMDLIATLRRAQERPEEAVQLLEMAARLFQEVGDNHMAGRSLISEAGIHYDLGQKERLVDCLRQGLALIDLESEPELAMTALQHLALARLAAGQHEEALVALNRSRILLNRIANHRALRVGTRWLTGQIYLEMGRFEQAEASLLVARQGLIRMGSGLEVAKVSLDLARLYAQRGRFADLKQLVGEMVPLFEAQDLHTNAMAALLLFRQAVETERATLGLVEEVRSYLEKSQSDPKLRFRPSAAH